MAGEEGTSLIAGLEGSGRVEGVLRSSGDTIRNSQELRMVSPLSRSRRSSSSPARQLHAKDLRALARHLDFEPFKREAIMPRGDKSTYSDKQKRKAEHIAEGYEDRGVPESEAERLAWATVDK